MPFQFKETPLKEVIVVQPKVLGDERGFFVETFKKSDFVNAGINENFNQDNHSKSKKGVLRGLHYQKNPHAQGKLVRVVQGSIFDVAIDIRRGSENFGKWFGLILSAENKTMLWVPVGFAHGFLTLEDDAEVCYKTTYEYNPEAERGIKYDDPTIAIDWPKLDCEFSISAKDSECPLLNEADINFDI